LCLGFRNSITGCGQRVHIRSGFAGRVNELSDGECIESTLLATEDAAMTSSSIPEGFHTVTPYLVVRDASALIHFLKQAFEAVESHRMTDQEENITHAQLQIGDSTVMLSDVRNGSEPMPGMLYIYVDDVDVVYQRAVQAGASSLHEPADESYGDRVAGVRDICGNQWWIAARKENLPPDEMMRRQGTLISRTTG
jgi:PhnB protein